MPFLDCSANAAGDAVQCQPLKYIQSNPESLILPSMIVLSAILLPCSCILYRCCRAICCRPKDSNTTPSACPRVMAKLVTIGMLALAVLGSFFLWKFSNDLMQSSVVSTFFDTVVQEIEMKRQDTFAILTAPDGTISPDIPIGTINTQFSNAEYKVANFSITTQSHYDVVTSRKWILMIAVAVPIFVLLIVTSWAMCNLRRCGTCCVQILLYIFFIPVALLFGTMMFVDHGVGDICHHIQEQRDGTNVAVVVAASRQVCDSISIPNWDDLEGQLKLSSIRLSQSACDALRQDCDDTMTSFAKPYYCSAELQQRMSSCSSSDYVSSILQQYALKPDAAPCSGSNHPKCTIDQCAKDCDDSTIRKYASQYLDSFNNAQRVDNVVNTIVTPMNTCSKLLLTLGPKPLTTTCNQIENDITHMKTGFCLLYVAFVVMIFVNVGAYRVYRASTPPGYTLLIEEPYPYPPEATVTNTSVVSGLSPYTVRPAAVPSQHSQGHHPPTPYVTDPETGAVIGTVVVPPQN
eukprot:PhF_6_TR12915/c0_g1_i1/m.20359